MDTPKKKRKPPVSFRFSDEVLDYFKSGGAGWQGRMHAVLRDYVQSRKGKPSG